MTSATDKNQNKNQNNGKGEAWGINDDAPDRQRPDADDNNPETPGEAWEINGPQGVGDTDKAKES